MNFIKILLLIPAAIFCLLLTISICALFAVHILIKLTMRLMVGLVLDICDDYTS